MLISTTKRIGLEIKLSLIQVFQSWAILSLNGTVIINLVLSTRMFTTRYFILRWDTQTTHKHTSLTSTSTLYQTHGHLVRDSHLRISKNSIILFQLSSLKFQNKT